MKLGWFETSLPVADIAASAAFYGRLGFESVGGGIEARTVTVNRGDCRLALFERVLDPDEVQLIFWQGDVEAIANGLAGRGIDFVKPLTSGPDGASAMLRDPDGHVLYFITMPVHFAGLPRLEQAAPPSRPLAANESDRTLGWFELSLTTSDPARAGGFYAMLGFTSAGVTEDGRVTLENEDCRIALVGAAPPAKPMLVFRQSEAGAIRRELVAAGIAFDEVPAANGRDATLVVEDPDGYVLSFVTTR